MANNDNIDEIVIPEQNKVTTTSATNVDNSSTSDVYAQISGSSSQSKEKKKPRDKRTTSMVLGIVFFVIGAALALAAVLWFNKLYLSADTGNKQLNGFLTVFIFAITYGLITYVPSLIFTIVGIVMSSVGSGSDSKGRKAVSIIFLILNIVLLIVLIGLFILAGSIAAGVNA